MKSDCKPDEMLTFQNTLCKLASQLPFSDWSYQTRGCLLPSKCPCYSEYSSWLQKSLYFNCLIQLKSEGASAFYEKQEAKRCVNNSSHHLACSTLFPRVLVYFWACWQSASFISCLSLHFQNIMSSEICCLLIKEFWGLQEEYKDIKKPHLYFLNNFIIMVWQICF